MASERIIPADPLTFIQRCVRERKILWTYHVQMRLKGRTLSREALLQAVGTYEIIESYPEDKYLPSYLVYCNTFEGVAHIQIAADVAGENVRIVTVYRPSSEEWTSDCKTRRSKS
jgi:3-mercaptopyruvate sulfurtransferase SseA